MILTEAGNKKINIHKRNAQNVATVKLTDNDTSSFFAGNKVVTIDATITPTVKIPTRFEMFQINIKFFKAVFGFIVVGVISQKEINVTT